MRLFNETFLLIENFKPICLIERTEKNEKQNDEKQKI
jgi:hypothetical protein